MALTPYQRELCRLLAAARIRRGESYVAGGAALNEWLRAPRVSRDVALLPADQAGRAVLSRSGSPFRGEPSQLRAALHRADLVFHEGRIGGALPAIVR